MLSSWILVGSLTGLAQASVPPNFDLKHLAKYESGQEIEIYQVRPLTSAKTKSDGMQKVVPLKDLDILQDDPEVWDLILSFGVEVGLTQSISADVKLTMGDYVKSKLKEDFADFYYQGMFVGIAPGARAIKTGLGYGFGLMPIASQVLQTPKADLFMVLANGLGMSAQVNWMYSYSREIDEEEYNPYPLPDTHHLGAELTFALFYVRASIGFYVPLSNPRVETPSGRQIYNRVLFHSGVGVGGF